MKQRGWCQMHYFRWRRHGDPTMVLMVMQRQAPGTTCKQPGCEKPHATRGWCQMHYTRWYRHGDADIRETPVPRRGSLSSGWRGNDAGYTAIHDRMRRAWGSASRYPCAMCNKPAAHWAYDHADPNENHSIYGAYSTDTTHYLPMCVPCHKRHDLAVATA